MAIAAKKATLTTLLQTFRTKVLALFTIPVQQVNSADNALKLGNLTTAQISDIVEDQLDAHLALTNPHQMTPALLQSLNIASTTALFQSKLLKSALPISGITVNGQLSTNNGSLVLPSGSTIFVSGIGRTTTAAINFTLPTLTVGVQYFIYLELFQGECRLTYTSAQIPESQNFVLVTSYTLTTTANHVIPNTMNLRIRRVDTYRLSVAPAPWSFIATKSDPTQPVTNLWS